MATSDVAIANRALQILGSPTRLESLSENDPNARTMNAAYTKIRDALFRKYKWGFTIARASIAADAAQTTWGELNRYTLPSDFIRLLRDDESGLRRDWKREGNYIVTKDSAPLQIRYIARITDPTLFDVSFDEVFAHRLAMATCKEITGSRPSAEQLEESDQALADAKQANAYEEDAVEPLEDDWFLARF